MFRFFAVNGAFLIAYLAVAIGFNAPKAGAAILAVYVLLNLIGLIQGFRRGFFQSRLRREQRRLQDLQALPDSPPRGVG